MKKLLLFVSFYLMFTACDEDRFQSPIPEEYTITNKTADFEIRVGVNGQFYKLKTNECVQLSASQLNSLQLGVRPLLVQIEWLRICEAKSDSDICNIEDGAWLDICKDNDCTEVTHYEIYMKGETDPFIIKVENKNTGICLDINTVKKN